MRVKTLFPAELPLSMKVAPRATACAVYACLEKWRGRGSDGREMSELADPLTRQGATSKDASWAQAGSQALPFADRRSVVCCA